MVKSSAKTCVQPGRLPVGIAEGSTVGGGVGVGAEDVGVTVGAAAVSVGTGDADDDVGSAEVGASVGVALEVADGVGVAVGAGSAALRRVRYVEVAAATAAGLELGRWFEAPVHPVQTNLAAVGYTHGVCPVSEAVCRRIVNLPCHPGVTGTDIERYVALLRNVEG